MKLLLQKNIWGEYGYDRFIDSIERNSIPYQMVNSIPFTEEFDEPVIDVPDFTFGSTRFINVCRQKGFPVFPAYSPGICPMFPHDFWINGHGEIIKFGELNITTPVFIKPFTEKFFTGLVVENNDDLETIQLSTSFIEDISEELILVTDVVHILEEVRFFVIGGQLITGSGYRLNGLPKHFKIDQMHPAWERCKNILKSNYSPLDDGFVIDLGLVNGEWKIVELNNLNSSGFYESDTDVIVRSLIHFNSNVDNHPIE